MFISRDKEDRSKLGKNVLPSSPREGGSCRSETKHDRRIVIRIIFRKGNYRNTSHSYEKAVLGSSSGEVKFCSLEIKCDRRKAPRLKLFVSKRYPERSTQPRESVLGSCPGKVRSYLSGT
jgi:hypothetical protein